jgi:iron complex transport system permease protein
LTIALLVAAFIGSMYIGRYPIKAGDLFSLLWGKISGHSAGVSGLTSMVFWKWRLPRLLCAMLIGGALSISGAAYQGILRNPIVAPDILGAASGACFGAALGILLGFNALLVQIIAFAFGLAAVGLAFFVSNSLRGSDRGGILMLILSGMVVTALFSAGISIIKYVGDPYNTLPAITFWLMGGLTAVSASDVKVLLIPFLVGVIPLLALRWKINILCFDDEEAGAMGSDARTMRGVIILCATLLTCSAVAVGGMIGWVGLIIPHICRMVTGPDHKKLLPVALVAGMLYLILVDDLARCAAQQELPLGILTAVIGAPLFLVQLYRGRRSFE